MYSKKLNEKVHTLRDLERMVSDLSIQINNIKDELKSEMTKKNVSELTGEDWKISWNSYETSRFDQNRFKSSCPDLYEQFKVSIPSRKFLLK